MQRRQPVVFITLQRLHESQYAPVVNRLKKRLLELKEQYGDQDEDVSGSNVRVREAIWES